MTPAKVRAPVPIPEIAHPECAANDAYKSLADVEYLGKLVAIAFRFADGKIFGVPVRELEGLDESPVTRVFISFHGYEATIEQFSGNQVEVPWDAVLYHADPSYPYRRPEPGSPEESEHRRVDQVIGDRVRRVGLRLRKTGAVGIVAYDDRDRQRHPA